MKIVAHRLSIPNPEVDKLLEECLKELLLKMVSDLSVETVENAFHSGTKTEETQQSG